MTTGSTTAEEHHLNYEREEPKAEVIAISAADALLARVKELFRADGHIMRAVRKLEELIAQGMRSERGPDPDTPLLGDEDVDRIVRLAIKYGGNRYEEAPKENGIKAIIIGCTVTIISAGIIAVFVLGNQFSEFRGQVSEWQKSTERRLEMLERHP